MRRTLCTLLLALAGAYPMLAAVAPTPAAAHATLVASEPADGATVTALRRVVLRFGGPVEAAGSHLLLTDGRESQPLGPVRHGGDDRTLVVDVPDVLDGTYTVAWHVLAGDGDALTGRLVVVQTSPAAAAIATADPAAAPAPVVATGSHTHGDGGLASSAMRLFVDLALAALLGGLVFVAAVWPAGAAVPRVHAFLRAAAVLAGAGAIALPVLQHLTAGGGPWSELLHYRFGRVALARLLLLVAAVPVLEVLRRRGERAARAPSWRLAVTVVGLGLLETVVLLGHAGRAGGVDGVTRLAHAVGLSAWLGGLLVVVVVVLPRRDPAELRTVLPRFSALATAAVGLLVAAGVVLSVDLVGAAAALGTTAYGRVLVLKLGAVALLLAAAWRSRSHVRRRIDAGASRALATWVGLEVGLVGAVFALTAVLVSQAPPA